MDILSDITKYLFTPQLSVVWLFGVYVLICHPLIGLALVVNGARRSDWLWPGGIDWFTGLYLWALPPVWSNLWEDQRGK